MNSNVFLFFLCCFYSFSSPIALNESAAVLKSLIKADLIRTHKESKDKEFTSNAYRVKTIVLDAGHGGKDFGCSGKKSKEKRVALNVVLKLGNQIERNFPKVRVIYTRKTDVFIPLHKRAAIANKNKADLFISIHCNALSHNAHLVSGSETYVMGLHTAEHNLDVARRENEAILLEEDYQKNYEGFDPNSDEGNIFLSMFQNAFLHQSILFAEKVESKIKVRAKRRSRGVKQAGFVVLKETTMPSVLIETGYLTNGKDEAFLATNGGQTKMANAIFEAFKDYKQEVEDQAFEPVAAEIIVEKKQQTKITPPMKTYPVALQTSPTRASQPIATPTNTLIPANMISSKTNTYNPLPPPVKTAIEPTPVVKIKAPKEKIEIIFKTQLAASPSKIQTSNQKWSKVPYVEVRKENNLYKYLSGSHLVYKQAIKYRNDLLGKGFNGAFIVAYKNGERISLKEARAAANAE